MMEHPEPAELDDGDDDEALRDGSKRIPRIILCTKCDAPYNAEKVQLHTADGYRYIYIYIYILFAV